MRRVGLVVAVLLVPLTLTACGDQQEILCGDNTWQPYNGKPNVVCLKHDGPRHKRGQYITRWAK